MKKRPRPFDATLGGSNPLKRAKSTNSEGNSNWEQNVSLHSNLDALLKKHGESELNGILSFLVNPEGFEKCRALATKPLYVKPTHILDPVHGHVEIDPRMFCIIDKPEFQRLRRIRQLGMCFLIYPSACHNRFCHSIGAYHLADKLLKKIKHLQRPRNLTDRLIFLISTAALVHDIGHGPFSHSFEQVLKSLFQDREIPTHEVMGGRIIDSMCNKYPDIQKEYRPEDIELIKCLMEPELPKFKDLRRRYSEKGLSWIFRVISGPLDIDKLDYIYRDSYHSGLGIGTFGLQRIIGSVRVMGDEIAFDQKALQEIVDILRKRWSYHKQMYQHKSSHAFEFLLAEALKEYFIVKGVDKLKDLEYYIKLDDSILSEIRRSTNPELKKARKVLSHIDFREQPRLIWHCWAMPSLEPLKKEFITEENLRVKIGNYCLNRLDDVGGVMFEMSDIFVRWGSFSLGAVPGYKDKHPLSAISLFANGSPNKLKKLANPQEMFSLVGLGSRSVEYWIRVYVRYPEQQDVIRPIVEDFFKNRLKVLGGIPQVRLSPMKKPRTSRISSDKGSKKLSFF